MAFFDSGRLPDTLRTGFLLKSGDALSGRRGQKGVEIGIKEWEITTMKMLTLDAHKRIRLNEFAPQTVFAYQNNGNGTITLTVAKAEPKPEFPRGSLKPFITKEWEDERLALVKGCLQEPLSE